MLPLRDARPPRRTPVVTAVLLAACTLAWGWELVVLTVGGEAAFEAFLGQWGLVPKNVVGALSAGDLLSQPVLTLLAHMFLHGSWLHLMVNMLFLWIFAVNVEDRLGRVLFLLFYLAGGIAAATGQILVDPSSDLPMVGASGAIAAVLGGYLVLFPRARIQTLVVPIFYYELRAVPAVLVLGFWFALQLIDGVASLGLASEAGGGVAFWAHIGGFVAGVAMALPLRILRRDTRARDPLPAGPAELPAGPAEPLAADALIPTAGGVPVAPPPPPGASPLLPPPPPGR